MKTKSKENILALAFQNRIAELQLLTDWAAASPRLAVIHGRRRLGKTSLLRQWCRRGTCCYVLATEGTPSSQRAAFAEDLAAVVPYFGDVTYPTWRALFRALASQWPRDETPPLTLIIDELPYLIKASPELASVLQGLVDDPALSHLPLVLCGSSQRMMQGLVLDRAAPLYGRAQLLLRLEPLSVSELGSALAVDDPREIIEAYSAWGGVPRYWELVAREKGALWDAVTSLVLSPSGVLHEEASRVLRDEEAATLERALCQAIGLGAHRPSELAGRLGIPATSLSKPLRHLVELGLARRDAPYDFRKGSPSRTARSSLYRLDDPFLSMWYRCVHPYLSGLELEIPAARRQAQEAWQHHVGAVWETLVRRHWHHLAVEGRDWLAAGRHWEGRKTTGREWDVVSVTSDRRTIMLGECKWHRKLSQRDIARIVHDMKTKDRPPEVASTPAFLCLFLPSVEGLPRELDGVLLIDANDLLQAVSQATP
jgi:AAA+ ATPase superfamily predicted ATPase